MRPTEVAKFFYGWTTRTLNNKMNIIKDEYDIPFEDFHHGRRFSLYDVERITRLFLNRGIIDYRKFYAAMQVLTAMGANHNLL